MDIKEGQAEDRGGRTGEGGGRREEARGIADGPCRLFFARPKMARCVPAGERRDGSSWEGGT